MNGVPVSSMAPDVSLAALGWEEVRDQGFAPYVASGLEPARVAAEHRGGYVVRTATDTLWAEVSGRFRFAALGLTDFPAVGDWVAVDPRPAEGAATIHVVLARRSAFIRRAPGRGVDEQVLAANIDAALVVMSLNRDFNLRRLERYLATAWESGAEPAVVLSKADTCQDVPARVAEVRGVAPGVRVEAVSALTGTGLASLGELLAAGRTLALLGSSGVGKSTLINALAGQELLDVGEVREDDDRGRHTTTHRQLVQLPGGALIIDTPGLRELGLVDEGGLGQTFAQVDDLAGQCRFSDCSHGSEPGCAVQAAIAVGELPEERLRAHRKLLREARHAETERDPRARAAERRRWAMIGASVKQHMRLKYGDGLEDAC